MEQATSLYLWKFTNKKIYSETKNSSFTIANLLWGRRKQNLLLIRSSNLIVCMTLYIFTLFIQWTQWSFLYTKLHFPLFTKPIFYYSCSHVSNAFYGRWIDTNLAQVTKGTVYPTKQSREYGIPYLCIHKIDLTKHLRKTIAEMFEINA